MLQNFRSCRTGFSTVARWLFHYSCRHDFDMSCDRGINPLRCGASFPLYGQSGGGVEVEFSKGFKNLGPIANTRNTTSSFSSG